MENPHIIALVAIAISVIGLGLVVANVFNLQTTLINLNTSLVEQSHTIKSLNQQQTATQQVIEEQSKSIMKMQEKTANLTSEIKSLEEKVTSLEQRLQSQCLIPEGCRPLTQQRPVYFPGVVKFYNAADGGGVDDNRVFKQLPSTLSADSWVTDFDYQFTSSNIPAAYPLALTSTSANPEQLGPKGGAIIVYHGADSDVLHLRVWLGSTVNDAPGLYNSGIPISPNAPYFVRLERTPTQLVLSVFSDSARTNQVPSSPVTLAISPNDLTNLNFVQHSTSLASGPARTLTAQVDNTKIFVKGVNGVSQTLFQDDYSSSKGWTQIGSSIAVNGSFVAPVPQVYYNRPMLG